MGDPTSAVDRQSWKGEHVATSYFDVAVIVEFRGPEFGEKLDVCVGMRRRGKDGNMVLAVEATISLAMVLLERFASE